MKKWKRSINTPVLKKPCPQEKNSHRPVALTSIVTNSMEQIMVSKLQTDLCELLDLCQLASKSQWVVMMLSKP